MYSTTSWCFSCPLLLVPSCLSASVRVVACRFALGCWDC